MPAAPSFQAPTGTRDVLPAESARWEALVAAFARLAGAAGYGYAITPLFEDLGVFARGVGEGTDIVTKEMYEFDDRGGRRLALRPEVTASVVRAFIQHHPAVPWKVWYWGPNFRYERPQAGRYRQFFQLGAEVLGTDDPYVDIELIALTRSLCTQLGLSQVTLLINSLGDAQCRPAYREVLVSFLEGRADQLCDEHRDRWKDNPLRVLDCKRESCRSATADAPSQLDHLCDPCQAHWDAVVDGLGALGVAYEVAPRLVRGLDYYTRTTFELAADALDNAQNAIGGGGRYNGLVEALGGPPTPGIGFSMGIDRLLLACDAEGVFADVHAAVDVFVVDVVGGKEALLLTDELRRAGLRADRAFDQRSMKSQLKAADRSQAAVAVIVGEDERAAGTASLRVLRGAGPSGAGDAPRAQLVVPRGDVSRAVRDLIDETRAAGADPKENGL